MKFLVISDTHGDIEKAAEIYRSLPETDAVIHLGDLEEDFPACSQRMSYPSKEIWITAIKRKTPSKR